MELLKFRLALVDKNTRESRRGAEQLEERAKALLGLAEWGWEVRAVAERRGTQQTAFSDTETPRNKAPSFR